MSGQRAILDGMKPVGDLRRTITELTDGHTGEFYDWREGVTSLAGLWAITLGELDSAGLSDDCELDLLLETTWALGIASPTLEWQGITHFRREWGSIGYPLPSRNGADESPLEWLLERARSRTPAFCDARAPERAGSFEFFAASGWLRDRLIDTTVATLARTKARRFTPLLVVTHLRAGDPVVYAEVLDATRQCVELPDRPNTLDNRRLRWAADQIQGGWLSPAEIVRFLEERFIEPAQGADLAKWRTAMAAS